MNLFGNFVLLRLNNCSNITLCSVLYIYLVSIYKIDNMFYENQSKSNRILNAIKTVDKLFCSIKEMCDFLKWL